jgi:hypothetical protein
MSTFAIGEVAVLHGLIRQTEFNGMECIITSRQYKGFYAIDLPGFEEWNFSHRRNLRKKPKPKFDAAAGRKAMLTCIDRARQPETVAA